MRRCVECDVVAVWCHPADGWLCPRHAPPVERRGRCSAEGCGKPAAWWHPTDGVWLCLQHMPGEVG